MWQSSIKSTAQILQNSVQQGICCHGIKIHYSSVCQILVGSNYITIERFCPHLQQQYLSRMNCTTVEKASFATIVGHDEIMHFDHPSIIARFVYQFESLSLPFQLVDAAAITKPNISEYCRVQVLRRRGTPRRKAQCLRTKTTSITQSTQRSAYFPPIEIQRNFFKWLVHHFFYGA